MFWQCMLPLHKTRSVATDHSLFVIRAVVAELNDTVSCAVECNARDMRAVRHIIDGAKAMCTSLRSWLHRKDNVVRICLNWNRC